jgi:hypothetical protein
MVNRCELLVNVVMQDKPKVLGCDDTVEPRKGSQAWAKRQGVRYRRLKLTYRR